MEKSTSGWWWTCFRGMVITLDDLKNIQVSRLDFRTIWQQVVMALVATGQLPAVQQGFRNRKFSPNNLISFSANVRVSRRFQISSQIANHVADQDGRSKLPVRYARQSLLFRVIGQSLWFRFAKKLLKLLTKNKSVEAIYNLEVCQFEILFFCFQIGSHH